MFVTLDLIKSKILMHRYNCAEYFFDMAQGFDIQSREADIF